MRFHPLTGRTRRGDLRHLRSARHRSRPGLAPRWFDLIVVPLGRRRSRAAGAWGWAADSTIARSASGDTRRHWRGPHAGRLRLRLPARRSVFADAWDVRLDALATESGLQRISRGTFHESLAAQVRARHLQHRRPWPPGRGKTTAWDGVRNFQARNMLRDSMKKGDTAFFYHSSCEIPGIAGIVRIVKDGYPDKTAFDPQAPPLRSRQQAGRAALVRGRREARAQVQARHHAR